MWTKLWPQKVQCHRWSFQSTTKPLIGHHVIPRRVDQIRCTYLYISNQYCLMSVACRHRSKTCKLAISLSAAPDIAWLLMCAHQAATDESWGMLYTRRRRSLERSVSSIDLLSMLLDCPLATFTCLWYEADAEKCQWEKWFCKLHAFGSDWTMCFFDFFCFRTKLTHVSLVLRAKRRNGALVSPRRGAQWFWDILENV